MNKAEIWEILECCLLASDETDINYLIDKGFNPKLVEVGVQLYDYLKSKKINLEVANGN